MDIPRRTFVVCDFSCFYAVNTRMSGLIYVPSTDIDDGGKTRIGANGKPLKGDPELTKAQKKVVEDNLPTIRSAGKKIGKWLDYKEECG